MQKYTSKVAHTWSILVHLSLIFFSEKNSDFDKNFWKTLLKLKNNKSAMRA